VAAAAGAVREHHHPNRVLRHRQVTGELCGTQVDGALAGGVVIGGCRRDRRRPARGQQPGDLLIEGLREAGVALADGQEARIGAIPN
jgi:hypothetical protein